MTRPRPMSGFPEWLPEQRMIEQRFIESLRNTFELHGFAPIETRAVEPLDQLLRKGETSKEVYTLQRLQGSDDEIGPGLGLGLPGARRLVDEFEIDTGPGRGTTVTLIKWAHRG